MTRQDVSSVIPVNGTPGYADSYPVRGQGSGTLTSLPSPGPVPTATSDQHVVTVSLSAGQQGYVAAGDKVTITLPDQSTAPVMRQPRSLPSPGPARPRARRHHAAAKP